AAASDRRRHRPVPARGDAPRSRARAAAPARGPGSGGDSGRARDRPAVGLRWPDRRRHLRREVPRRGALARAPLPRGGPVSGAARGPLRARGGVVPAPGTPQELLEGGPVNGWYWEAPPRFAPTPEPRRAD